MRGRILPVLAAGALVLAACSLDPGQAAADDFDDYLAAHPYAGLSVVSTDGDLAVPFAGSVTITVGLAGSGLDVDDAAAVTTYVCGFDNADASFRFRAEDVTVPVDCADQVRWTAAWATLAGLPGLTRATVYDSTQADVVLGSAGRGLAALDALRTLPVDTLAVSTDGWHLFDDVAASPAAHDAVDAALGSGLPVRQAQVQAADGTSRERVIVTVARSVVARMKRAVLAGHPERRDVLVVRGA